MTPKEAIEFVNFVQSIYFGNTYEALYMAVKALEKQIPKIPDVYGDGYADGELVYDTWECPSCGETYEIEGEQHEYCPHCGQKIDWSEREEE